MAGPTTDGAHPAAQPAAGSQRAAPPLTAVPSWLTRVGTAAWLTLGILALATVAYLALSRLQALVAPLVVATVMGMLFHPLVDRAQRWGLSRDLGTTAVLLGIIAVVAGAVVLAVRGVVDQGPEILASLEDGWLQLQEATQQLGFDLEGLRALGDSLAGSNIGRWLSATATSVASLLLGMFIGAFLLYFLLRDWHPIVAFLAGHMGLPRDLGMGLVDDATQSIRRYFYGLTIASVLVSIVIGLAMWALGLPLAFTIALVTFVTSYVPYLGAIFAGAFACLVALGSGGVVQALIVLGVVVFTQNIVQTVVQTKITSDTLQLHPIVNLGSTIVGAAVAGIIGATLSAPVVAMLIASRRRLLRYEWSAGAAEPAGSAPGAGEPSAADEPAAPAQPEPG